MIIDKVLNTVYDLLRKNSSGGYLSPLEIPRLFSLAQNQKLDFDLKKSQGTSINDSLTAFKSTVPVTVVDGLVVLPSDFREFRSASYPNISGSKIYQEPFEELSDDEWNWRIASDLDAPTKEYPALIQRSSGIEVKPSTIQNIKLSYIVNPPDPIWGYTVVDNRRVFNEGTSVDFLYGESDIDDLVYRITGLMGFSIRDMEAYQLSKQEQVETER